MGYREAYFKENKGVGGKYRCAKCGGWFPKKMIDIDHIFPQSQIQFLPKEVRDNPANLQAMCQHCNRSKGADLSDSVGDFVSNNIKRGIKGLFK